MKIILSASFAIVVATGFVLGCSGATTSPSDSTDAGKSGDGGTESGTDAGGDAACANHNDSRCPAIYTTSLANQPCAPIGLSCKYIGSGSGSGAPPGCGGVATLFCHGDGGLMDTDGGTDAGAGVWGFLQ